jgi:hypothetical protein
MKLHECTYGRMVITEDKRVGHVIGVTYNVRLAYTGGMSNDDLFERTIPLVKFADGKHGVHHGNLQPFNG